MKKYTFIVLMFFVFGIKAQNTKAYELALGLKFQKTEQLYWENGVAADFTSDFLVHKKIHLKLSYLTSRIGSAFLSNAIRQDNVVFGADWRFRSDKDFQVYAGLNTGFFHADMELPKFDVLPHNSLLLQMETGFFYKFKFPAAASVSLGYNVINGDGVNLPGTLFPVYYQLSFFYYLNNK